MFGQGIIWGSVGLALESGVYTLPPPSLEEGNPSL